MFRTQSLNRGYIDRGLYGYRDLPITQGPGQYTPYTVLNTPTHRMVDPRYYPDRERSRDVLHARDMEPMFLSLSTLERNQPILPSGRPKKPDKALELLPKEQLVDEKIFLTLPRSTWCRCPVRQEEVTKRPQEDRERYVRVHARSTPVLLGMQDMGKQTHTTLAPTVQGSNSLSASQSLKFDKSLQQAWGPVSTDSVNTRSFRKKWGTGFGSDMAEKSLKWFRKRDDNVKKYLLESTRERQMNLFEVQHKEDEGYLM
jgi:hypothetical protein